MVKAGVFAATRSNAAASATTFPTSTSPKKRSVRCINAGCTQRTARGGSCAASDWQATPN